MLDVRFRPLEKWREKTPLGSKNGQFKMPPGAESVWSPADHSKTTGRVAVDLAAAWLAARTPWATGSGAIIDDYDTYRRAYRGSAASLHPDRGGSAELFLALGEVARVLEAHHAKRAQLGANGAATASGGAVARG